MLDPTRPIRPPRPIGTRPPLSAAVAALAAALPALGLVLALALAPTSALAQWQPNGLPVCTAAGDQDQPVVVADGQGGAYIIWEDRRGADPQVYAQRLNALGVPQWGANGILVSSGSYPQYGPVAAGDGTGGVIIAWILSLVPGAATAQGQRLHHAGTPHWGAGGIPIIPGAAFPVKLTILPDFSFAVTQPAGVLLAWTDFRAGLAHDIYMQAIDGLGAQRWGAAVCTAAGVQRDIQMVSDGSAPQISLPKGAILTWRDGRDGTADDDIYAQRVNNAGTVMWGVDGLGVATEATNVQEPVIVPAGSQNAIVGWPGYVGNRTYGLIADRVGSLGPWAAPVILTDPTGLQREPFALSDQAGGIVACWNGPAPSLARDLYAQRLSSTGARLWGEPGVVVCDALGTQSDPVMLSGRSNTYLAIWVDGRGGIEGDLYAQLIDANGAKVWTPDDGLPLCVAPGTQEEIAAAPDTSGGAIVAWTDWRNGAKDIYATRVTGGGGVVAAEIAPAPGPSIDLAPATPNPTRAGVVFALELPVASEITATVHDASGRRVRMLHASAPFEAGRHRLAWDGTDDGGSRVPAGVYWLSAGTGGAQVARRAVVLE